MGMIKLTPVDGEPMYLKADAIIAFWWLGDRTEVRMPGDFGFDVKETPEQILDLINQPIGAWVTEHHER